MTVKSGDLKTKERPLPLKKRVTAAIVRIPLKAVAHCLRLPGAASPAFEALDLCFLS
jgi:hypothetical protein